MIVWDESLMTGVATIDAQHKELINRYNTLAEAIELKLGTGEVPAIKLLNFLKFYAVWHFEEEETCMEKYQCPAAAANKEAHAEFIERFGGLYDQWEHHHVDADLIYETYVELGAWIVNHIQGSDMQLGPCIKLKKAKEQQA